MTPAVRKRWLALRRMGIGASDVAGCLLDPETLHPWSPWVSPTTIYLDKLGRLPEVKETPSMQRGNRLEGVMLDWWSEGLLGVRLVRPTVESFIAEPPPDAEVLADGEAWTLRSKRWPWLLATPDAVLYGRDGVELVENKVISEFAQGDWYREGDLWPPPYYTAQVQAQMAVYGATAAWVVVSFGGLPPQGVLVPRDEVIVGAIVDATRELWDRIQRQEPPPIDSSEATARALQNWSMVRLAEAPVLASPPDHRAVDTLAMVRSLEDYVTKALTLAENQLLRTLADQSAEEILVGTERFVLNKPKKDGTRSLVCRTRKKATADVRPEVAIGHVRGYVQSLCEP